MTKKIGFYMSAASYSSDKAPIFYKEYYKLAYEQLFGLLTKMGCTPVLVFDQYATYLGDGVFSESWTVVVRDGKVTYEKNDDNAKMDLLYDRNLKDRFMHSDVKRINSERILDICSDKYKTYLFIPEECAETILVQTQEQLSDIAQKHRGVLKAVKGLRGAGGKNVFIGDINDYDGKFGFPILVQDFIDTTCGYKKLASGLHDVRVGIFDGEIIHGRVREPAIDGELRSNMGLGGSTKTLFVSEIPKELKERAQKIDAKLDDGPRFIAADFGFDGTEWKLFELNSKVGLVHESEDGPAANEFLQKLAEKLVENA